VLDEVLRHTICDRRCSQAEKLSSS
jgi:hypothetical protein